MNAAEQAANGPGNSSTTRRRRVEEAPVLEPGHEVPRPGDAAQEQVSSLQGEARIAKADEATALFLKAKAVFEQGAHVTE
jgi:hypothetical protein